MLQFRRGVLQGRESSAGGGGLSSGGSGPGWPQAPLGGDRRLLGGPAAVTLVSVSGAGRTVTRLFPRGLGRALGFPDGPLSGSLGGGGVPAGALVRCRASGGR